MDCKFAPRTCFLWLVVVSFLLLTTAPRVAFADQTVLAADIDFGEFEDLEEDGGEAGKCELLACSGLHFSGEFATIPVGLLPPPQHSLLLSLHGEQPWASRGPPAG